MVTVNYPPSFSFARRALMTIEPRIIISLIPFCPEGINDNKTFSDPEHCVIPFITSGKKLAGQSCLHRQVCQPDFRVSSRAYSLQPALPQHPGRGETV